MVISMIEKAVVPPLGFSSQPPFSIDFVPVTYLASALVALNTLQQEDSPIKEHEVYHIGNVALLSLKDMPDLIKEIWPDVEEFVSVP
ncbi:hypothetical protein F5B22DRAFT_593436 [Xylaria bambusicola]|uniref:uncharacterized protein n=1 Tax=Xylaria bambusicola TaxID=326684 RepID=UPI002008D332|nr:uncharacterized protein F5B22DRAFT_593436 [Xylaria bambusicola]KAI0522236.1 hypothetical protein F5B22DRAFT_593436 [Xylaria bambusicola]